MISAHTIEEYQQYILSADWILLLFYGFLLALALYSLSLAINTFRLRITWGQARVMGVPLAIFMWLQGIFYFTMFEGAYGIVSVILATPLWLDLILSILSTLAILIIFFVLTRRPTFKPHLFIPLVLIPLGIPGTHLFAKLVRVGVVDVAPVGAVMVLKHGDGAAEFLSDYAVDLAANVPFLRQIPKVTNTVAGQITFLTTASKGVLGDALTARRLTALGYKKLPSKYDVVHGIDAIFVKWKTPGTVEELLIVENKVDGGRLVAGQMSDAWVNEKLNRLLALNDEQSNETARLVLGTLASTPELVKKQLWHHQLTTGTTVVQQLDGSGKPIKQVYEWRDRFIENELMKRCNNMPAACVLN